MDVVCIEVNDQNGNPLQASQMKLVDRDTCTIVASGGNGYYRSTTSTPS